IFFTLK
ncbi:unnamed protein product, partial [Leptidea sinapis]